MPFSRRGQDDPLGGNLKPKRNKDRRRVDPKLVAVVAIIVTAANSAQSVIGSTPVCLP